MSIFAWLKGVTGGGAVAPLHFAENERTFAGLDMKTAIDAHIAWKGRLEAQIRGDAVESLEIGVVASDGNCTLGKWLHEDGKAQFGRTKEFNQLVLVHEDFHLCAGAILSDARSGKHEDATRALKASLRPHSDAVQLALVRLYVKHQNQLKH